MSAKKKAGRSKRQLVVKPNKYGVGLDVGWRFVDSTGATVWEHQWGNTRSDATLLLLTADLRDRGFDFQTVREWTPF